jgi:8-oxo-dGTP pyrophosphatase MutT (NUDIX family)
MFSRARSLKYKRSNSGGVGGFTPTSQFGQFCINCGKNNHTFTQCNEPFSSYGVICFHKSPVDSVKRVLMVCRRHSVYYVEFLRGKYDVNNLEYLITLFSRMTRDEIRLICSSANFEVLRNDLGLDNTRRRVFRAEYETSELKFNYILNLGTLAKVIQCINYIFDESFQLAVPGPDDTPVNNSTTPESPASAFKLQSAVTGTNLGNLGEFLQENRDVLNELKAEMTSENAELYDMPEWEVPKGKRQNKETDLQCAIREFCEETGLAQENIRIFKNVVPLEEVYTGINGIEYKHIYFIGEIVDIPNSLVSSHAAELKVDGQCREQVSEVSKIMFMDLATVNEELRVFHVSKRNIIQKAFYIIGSLYNFFYY